MPSIILIENDYPDKETMLKVLNYVFRSALIGGYALDPAHAFKQMCLVKRVFHKEGGVQLKHFIVSFTFRDMLRIDLDDVLKLGSWAGGVFCEYQMAYAVHTDSAHIHLHVVMNTVSFIDGHKYNKGRIGFFKLRAELQELFPKSDVGLYWSDPRSRCSKFTYTENDYLLRIDR